MTAIFPTDTCGAPSLDLGVEIASREVAHLVSQLEGSLTPGQRTQLHRIRLAAESLGAARASQQYRRARV